ncbi:ubiquitin thioesterase otubain-like family protein [Besnoitia besnoiti]|uniref:ubiquitinyl hydrolase 1 n=1 Tax=Besnoitia besnoiti TaxID=94643 RepID=A0A2A9M831_BESBE|nr:ubiquitin thioesterase otubain-like family protein [Besnoitia besnoiti]PFH33324.1 ubiquitin thioesterase otubain-like family protein [Besnoitia besnoiti]
MESANGVEPGTETGSSAGTWAAAQAPTGDFSTASSHESEEGSSVPEWQQEVHSQPLVGGVESLSSLLRDFEGNEALCRKTRAFIREQQRSDAGAHEGQLPTETTERIPSGPEAPGDEERGAGKESDGLWAMRRIRKDGCCFYRAYMYGLFLYFLRRPQLIRGFVARINDDLLPLIQQANGGAETVADFAEETVESLEKLEAPESDVATLDSIFNDMSSSNYIVVFARLLASTHLKLNSEMYLPFVTAYATVEEYCSHEVDPMWVEAEQLQITALTAMTQMPVEIVYFDQSPGDEPTRHIFPQAKEADIHLIYRPGHYDIFFYSPVEKRQSATAQSVVFLPMGSDAFPPRKSLSGCPADG